ncbi:uncharacterized protein LOC132544159 [Ylistrum balloti]|uniref:uncharacterized protein LOC132544159 n=1 Tax=Ylistrum balloti TaxID=509963 RepID=UPI0029059DD4|nr:uncharacterized protein LOC132544159 [Ylistrum balloti]
MGGISKPYFTEVESSILFTTQVVLSGIAVVLNVLLLVVIRSSTQRYNATEVLQICKTFLVLLTLLICMPLQIFTIQGRKQNNISICLLNDFTEKLLFDAYPFVIMAVAITRLRVSICKGNSTVLVTTTSALVTFALCLLPTLISGTLVLVFHFYKEGYQHDDDNDVKKGYSFHECSNNAMARTYSVVLSIALGIIPVLVTVFMYYMICYKVSARRSKISFVSTKRSRCKSVFNDVYDANIKTTMFLLVILLTTFWFSYIILVVFNVYSPNKFSLFCLILWKPIILAIHPLSEGLFLENKRHRIVRFFADITVCKQNKNKKATPEVEIQTKSTYIRHTSVKPFFNSVELKSIESTENSSHYQKRYSTQSMEPHVDLNGELFEENITLSPYLHTRRTGQPRPPMISIMHRTSSHKSPMFSDQIELSGQTSKKSKSCLKKSTSNFSLKRSSCNSCYNGKMIQESVSAKVVQSPYVHSVKFKF